jgi:hypothetical protein
MKKSFKSTLQKRIEESETRDAVISVRIPGSLYKELEKIAKEERAKLSLIILAALESAVVDYRK